MDRGDRMLQVRPWSRRHSRLLRDWACDDICNSVYRLRADFEPYWLVPSSLAILFGEVLIGRFTYRTFTATSTFTGIVLDPTFRGRRLACPAIEASTHYLAEHDNILWFYASVAAANKASLNAHIKAGYKVEGFDWRKLSSYTFDISFLSSLGADVYYNQSLLYYHMILDTSGWRNGSAAG